MSSRLASLRRDMEKCFRCSLCKMVPLPVANHPEFTDACPGSRFHHFHGYSGSGKQIMALSLLDGRIPADHRLAEIVYACTTCGYCDVACKFIMDAERHQVNLALREHLCELGLAPPPHPEAIKKLAKSAAGESPERDLSPWASGLDLPRVPSERAEVLLLGGCMADYDPGAGEVARKLARLLLKAGVSVGVLDRPEPCCGLPAYWLGAREVFSELATGFASKLEQAKVRVAVVVSGSCLGAVRGKYPEYARVPAVPVYHATEFLRELVGEGRLRLTRPIARKVTYHDPCYLGRQSEPFTPWQGEEKLALGCMTYTDPPKPLNYGVRGVYDAPRELLRKIPGLEVVEMYRIREYSFCCGGGGGVPAADPEFGLATARHRLDEAKSASAEVLVTACHHCVSHLRRASESMGKERLPVLDIIDLLDQAAGGEK